MKIDTSNLNIINKSILYEFIDPKAFPLESTGLIFRGIGQRELDFIRQHDYIASNGKGNDADQEATTCFSQLYSQAEGYARSNYDLYNEQQAYVIAVMPPITALENQLGEIEVVGKIPSSNIVAVLPIDQLNKAMTKTDAKKVHKDLPPGGVWRTMNGHHIYVKGGKVLAGAVPAVKGGAKRATKAQLAVHQDNLDKQAAATKAKKKKTPATTPKKSKKLTKKQLFAAIDKTEPYQKYKPTQTVVDWGNGRGQGKRSGKMVVGAMGDAPKGKKTYTNIVGGVPDYEKHKVDFTNMTERDKLNYLKAREYGLNHEQAMIYQLANSGKHELSDEKIMERIEHFAGKPAAKASTGSVMQRKELKDKAAAKKTEPKAPAKKATPAKTKAQKAKEETAAARKAIDDIANSKPKEAKKKTVAPKDAKKDVEATLKGANNKGTKTKPVDEEKSKAAVKHEINRMIEEEKKRPKSRAKGATKADLDQVIAENAKNKRTPKAPTKEDLDEMFGAGNKKTAAKKKTGVKDIRSDKQVNHDVAYDVGNKIGGAKKDMAALRAATDKLMSDSTGQSLDSLEDMSPEVAQKYCIKKNLLNPVDFKAEFDRGTDIKVAMCKQLIYDRIAPKPAGDTPEDRQLYLNAIRSLERRLEPLKTWDEFKDATYNLGSEMKNEKQSFLKNQEDMLRYFTRKLSEGPSKSDLMVHNYKTGKYDHITPQQWKAKMQERIDSAKAGIETHKKAIEKPYSVLGDKLTNFFTDSDSRNRTYDTIYKKKLDWGNYFKQAEEDASKPKEKGESTNTVKWERVMPAMITRSGGRKTPVNKPEDMVKNFGFSGVEFGNWVDDKSGNFHLIKCAEAFQDLADIIGVKDKDVSFNGKLSMAFGARGKGGALAHYEPASKVINITKNGGAGSLAHEWGHSLDNMLYQESAGHSSLNLASNGMKDQGTPEIKAAYKELMDAIINGNGDGHTMVENKNNRYYSVPTRYKQAVESLGYKDAIKTLAKGIAERAETEKQYYEGLRGKYNDDMLDKKIKSVEMKANKAKSEMVQVCAYLHEKATGEHLDQVPLYTGRSSYYENSGKVGGRNSKYWTSNHELFARAFENYVEGKMKTGKVKNDYLVHGTWFKEGAPVPYPTGSERDKIHACFDKLLEAVRKSGAIQKALAIMELTKSMDKGSSDEYVRRLLLEVHRVDHEYPENGPDYITSARHDDTWCQIWGLGMDWNCYYYMLNSHDSEPSLIAFIDDSKDGELKSYCKYVPNGKRLSEEAWRKVCEAWVTAHDKRLQKGNLGQEMDSKYAAKLAALKARRDPDSIDQYSRNAYNVPSTDGVIWIPINRLKCLYQTEKALSFNKIQENVEKMKRGENLEPVVIGYDHDIHDGHNRIEASKIMNYTHVPCVVGGANEIQVQRANEMYNEIWKSLNEDLQKDIEGEKQAILDYKQTIKDIKDPKIRKIIAEILADEENHEYNLKQVISYLKGDKDALDASKLKN